jgi:hypothetical protein
MTFKRNMGLANRSNNRWLPMIGIAAFAAVLFTPQINATQSITVPSVQPPTLPAAEITAGWLSLFDGQTLFGWHAMTACNWQVVDGEIRVDRGETGLLRSSAQFDDFELRLEFKSTEQTNSGVFIRTSPSPTDPTVDCVEWNIASREMSPFPTGSLVGRAATQQAFDARQWMSVRIVADGNRIQSWINEIQTCDYTQPEDRKLGRGYIGLQYNSGSVAFRNIKILPLNLQELPLDPKGNNWDPTAARNSTFEITENGALHVLGGPGQLESKDSFADFVLSFKCRTNKAGLNSGVFFRCIPGEFLNGYESQIQNQVHGEDPRRPVDCGTGGIFRRANARIVNARDQEWFSKTIIAHGPHISVWVNGMQVTDWTDRRDPAPNPRNGKRLEAGTIILQGHDPGTDILFKDFRVRELEARGR